MRGEQFAEDENEVNRSLRVIREELFNVQNILTNAPIDLPYRNLLRGCLSATSELTRENESTRLELMIFRAKLQTVLQECEAELQLKS
jgi:hypothetical protein